MSTKQETPVLLRLRAKVKRDKLPELCRKEGRAVAATLRVASALLHDEDLKGQQAKQCSAAVELAKEIHRLERKANDPGYPETARKQFLENEAKNEAFLPDFLKDKKDVAGAKKGASDEPKEK